MSIKSIAAIGVEKHRDLQIEMIDVALPQEGEVLVEIKATGLCHSDLHAIDGLWNFNVGWPGVFGHEGAGIVREVGPGVTRVKSGDHVVAFVPDCGHCPLCQSGKTNMCYASWADSGSRSRFSLKGQSLHPYMGLGTFTNWSVIPEISLVKVRTDMPFDQLSYLGCGASTGIGSVFHVAEVQPGTTVIVFGLGGIGLNVVQAARLAGATMIVAVDINDAKETPARRFGATHFVNPRSVEGDVVGHLNELTGGGADYTFEAVGNVKLMRQAFDTARVGWGTVTIIGLAPESDVFELPPQALLTGKKIVGSAMGGVKGPLHIPQLADWVMDGKIDLKNLITAHLPIERINEGVEAMRRGDGIRSVVTFA